MANGEGARKKKAGMKIEKLEDRIAPGGIGGVVGDLGVDLNSPNTEQGQTVKALVEFDGNKTPDDEKYTSSQEHDAYAWQTEALEPVSGADHAYHHVADSQHPDSGAADILTTAELPEMKIIDEQLNDDGSVVITFADGTVESHYADGAGKVVYADAATETWDGHGGGTFDDRQGNTVTWNGDGSGSWTSEDGNSGFHSGDGTGGYANGDGSHGTYQADGAYSHTDADGTLYLQNADGSGSILHADGTSESLQGGLSQEADTVSAESEKAWTDDHGNVVYEQTNTDGSGNVTYEDGAMESWYSDGSGSIIYGDGSNENWDGDGGGTYDDGEGNTYYWHGDGSGTWASVDGSSGSFRGDGSGFYQNADGGDGTWEADGAGTHREPDGITRIFNADGSGVVTYPEGGTETWEPYSSGYDGGIATESDTSPTLSVGAMIEAPWPPDPNGAVNGFILPLYVGGTEPAEWGLDYDEDGPSSWTLPISMEDINSGNASFKIPEALPGVWDGGIPPEASGPDSDGNYTIQSWPLAEVIDNGDGTITLILDLDAAL